MNKKIAIIALAVLALGATACSDTYRARMERTVTDKPTSVRCLHYGQVLFEGRSKGKVESDENGRLTFVDSSNNRLTAVEGECVVVYDR